MPKAKVSTKAKSTKAKTKPDTKLTKSAKAKDNGKPINRKFTKTEILNGLAKRVGIEPSQAKKFYTELEDLILRSVHPKGASEFALPGLLKIKTRKVPARKAGVMVRNPATGKMVPGKAKPASVRVSVRPLKKLKDAALGV